MQLSTPCCTLQPVPLALPVSPCRLRPEFLPVEEAENKIAIANGDEPPHRGSSQNPQEAAAKPAATGSSDLRALLEVRGVIWRPFRLLVQCKVHVVRAGLFAVVCFRVIAEGRGQADACLPLCALRLWQSAACT